MPPKKKDAAELKTLLGRPGNNLKIGVVGLPNVGKSTFFNALTNSSVAAENYPFCTIDPSEARVQVPDTRFDWLCDHHKPPSKIPAVLTVFDIAGLVKGASAGEGLGNAFLSHIRAVDGIFHVCRAFSDADVIHVEGDVDPIRDLDIIHHELRLKDEEFLRKHHHQTEAAYKRLGKNLDKDKKVELETLARLVQLVCEDHKDVRHGEWNNDEIRVINELTLLTAKPVAYLVNLSPEDFIKRKNKWLPKIKAWVDDKNPGSPDPIIPMCASLELKLTTMEDPAEREKHLKELGATSMMPKIITTGYNMLDLVYYFTAGPDEVRAWTIRRGTKAPQAAGVIHTDFEKAFIMGEIMKFDDLKEAGNEAGVKANGKYVQKGKDYIVTDGDICYWKVGQVNAGKKK